MNQITIPEGMKPLHDGTFVPIETPTKSTSEGRILLTEDEIAEQVAKSEAWEAGRVNRELAQKLANHSLNDDLEEILGLFSNADRAKLSAGLQDRYNSKKDLRLQEGQ